MLSSNPINNKFIQVDWSTVKEKDLDYFVIERSTDEMNYTTVGQEVANGTTNQLSEYRFNDTKVLPNINYYYRVKLVQTDGSIQYTHSVVAKLTSEGPAEYAQLYPNPVNGNDVHLEFLSNSTKSINITIFDAIGQRIYDNAQAVQQGINQYTINTQDWPAGVYLMQIHDKTTNSVITKEFIKSNY